MPFLNTLFYLSDKQISSPQFLLVKHRFSFYSDYEGFAICFIFIQFAIPTGVGYIDFQITSIPKKVTLKIGEKLLIQGIFR